LTKEKGEVMNKRKEVCDFTKVFKSYQGKSVALSPDEKKVIGSGNSPKEALKESIKKGTKEPIFLKVPSTDRSFVL